MDNMLRYYEDPRIWDSSRVSQTVLAQRAPAVAANHPGENDPSHEKRARGHTAT